MKLQLIVDLELSGGEADRRTLEAALLDNMTAVLERAVRENVFNVGQSVRLAAHTWSLQTLPDASTLVSLAEELGLKPEQVDELVHDAASAPASSINNGGLDDQIAFLVEQWGEEQTRAELEKLAASQDS